MPKNLIMAQSGGCGRRWPPALRAPAKDLRIPEAPGLCAPGLPLTNRRMDFVGKLLYAF